MSELEGESGEDVVEAPAASEIARTEEGRSQSPIGEGTFSDCLGDCRFAGPGEPVQPIDGRRLGVLRQQLYPVQDGLEGPLEAALAITMPKLNCSGTTIAVQHRQSSY